MLMIFEKERVNNMKLKDIEYNWKNKEFRFIYKEKKGEMTRYENVQITADLNTYHVMKMLKYMCNNHLAFIVEYNHEMKEALDNLVLSALKEVKKV